MRGPAREAELTGLSRVIDRPPRPIRPIVGGPAKVSTKLEHARQPDPQGGSSSTVAIIGGWQGQIPFPGHSARQKDVGKIAIAKHELAGPPRDILLQAKAKSCGIAYRSTPSRNAAQRPTPHRKSFSVEEGGRNEDDLGIAAHHRCRWVFSILGG